MSAVSLSNSWTRMFDIQVPATIARKGRSVRGRAPRGPSKPAAITSTDPSLGSPGRPYGLTVAELAVLACLAEGATNQEIATRRHCEIGTVKVHVSRIFRKLGVPNRARAVLVAQTIANVRDARIERACGEPFRLEWILAHMRAETRAAGVLLFRCQEPADALYFLQRGRIHLPELDRTLQEGCLFGEVGVFSAARRRSASAFASTPLRLFRLDADVARNLCLDNPLLALHLTGLLASRLATAASGARIPERDVGTGPARDDLCLAYPPCSFAGPL